MPEVRRQERGRRRIEDILRAAATVLSERGYEGTTTNAVAAAAGISPGSLYQYFRNKDEIAAALAEYYRGQLELFGDDVPDESEGLDLDGLLDRLLGPLVEFNLAHPGFKALFARTDMPQPLREAVGPAHTALHERFEALVGSVFPDLDPPNRHRVTTIAIQLLRGLMPLIVEADADERPTLVDELRVVLRSYLVSRGGHR
ncbi:transcriptional regulator, TetR family [Nocardia amikacinitolerans]|uniref:Transcriptional regulator, TetR family n=1 Tax=Nocardia amikacinitolerans TaxID=756689 RepID=A0A285LXE1_9NOCA|nr:TetR/AcrR family transcriptional regulator [Nocardia amikacinitolerans]MCP2280941.1 transcriptional regulator, TetR family [Nocardia amikacinitolerans]MCP2297956.1 transcriptional regulator, TetR family [Nocardia amikacinitolerans]MCP2320101.1 transcriptional regulator, TetR family [Nocardia amikacinitolerans]SNY89604.1 transcriptional regulator, TetR family [Nocardia amikacinitolerans]